MMDRLVEQIILAPALSLWTECGLPPDELRSLKLDNCPDPAVKSNFKLGTAAQTSIGISALGAAYFHKLRTGERQEVKVNARHAVIEFNSEKYYTIDGSTYTEGLRDELTGMYRAKEGHVRLHMNFPHHKQDILRLLGLTPATATRTTIEKALSLHTALSFEEIAMAQNLPVVALRPFAESDALPHARQAVNDGPVEIRKIGDAPKRDVSKYATRAVEGALEDIRVLDLTRVLAGPICGRTLAAHGADVLLVTSPNLPALPALDIETSRGKRTTQLDLTLGASRPLPNPPSTATSQHPMTSQSPPPAIPFSTKPNTQQSLISSPPMSPAASQSTHPSIHPTPAPGVSSTSRPPLSSRASHPSATTPTPTSNRSPPLSRGSTMTSVPTASTLKSTPVTSPIPSSKQHPMPPPSSTPISTPSSTSRPITTISPSTSKPTAVPATPQSTGGARFSAAAASEPQPSLTDSDKLRNLVKDCDVFLQAYRPGGLAKKGFGPEDVAKMRPGVVYASLTAHQRGGALGEMKGFDSLLQTMGGMNVAEATAYAQYLQESNPMFDTSNLPPYRELPMQALDHAAGYFLAYGISVALCKTITEGGSWEVHVSLGAVLHWIRTLGLLSPKTAFGDSAPSLPPHSDPLDPEIQLLSVEIEEAIPTDDIEDHDFDRRGAGAHTSRQAASEADDNGSLGANVATLRRPSFKGGEGSNVRRPSFKAAFSGMGLSGLSVSAGGSGPGTPSIGESTRLSGLRPEEETRTRKMTVIRHAAEMSRTACLAPSTSNSGRFTASTLQLSSLSYLGTHSQLSIMAKAKTRSSKRTSKQAAAPAPEPEPVVEAAAQEETPIAVDEPTAAPVEAPAAEIVEEAPAAEKPVESEDQEMVVDSQVQEDAVAEEAEKAEESQGPKLTLEERKAKLQQLRAKMRSSTIANRESVIEESEKAKMSVRDAARLEKQRKLAEVLRTKADAEERGEDVERLKNWEWTIEENDEWEKKLARKQRRADFEFHDDAHAARRRYKKDLDQIKPDLAEYNRKKEMAMGLAPGTLARSGNAVASSSSSSAITSFDPSQSGQVVPTSQQQQLAAESLYRNANSLLYADNKPSEDAIDRVVSKMNKDIEKKRNFSRKRANEDEGDITYINERNRVFNKKIARYYDKYTSEIRASFERGTAL